MWKNTERNRAIRSIAAAIGLFSLIGSLHAGHLSLTLDEAIKTALENSARLEAERYAQQIAQAQYRQAMSANFPHVQLSLGVSRRDQDINYKASGTFELPQDFTNQLVLSGAEVQDELTAALSGQPNTHTNLLDAFQKVQAGLIPAQSLPFEMDITTLGRDTAAAQLDLEYALYTGGRVSALLRQARLNERIHSEKIRRTKAEVIYDTRRYYYAVILAEKIASEVADTLERLKMVRDLTEAFYKGNSMRVKKTDYLRTLLTVDLARSMLEQSRSSVKLAKAALVNALGVPYDTEIEVVEKEFSQPREENDVTKLIEMAYRFNPDYNQLRLAIDISEAKIDESQSGYLPSIGFTANASHYYNSYDGGLNTRNNRNSWTIGIGLKWNLFNGFLDKEKIQQAKLEKKERQHTEILLKKGLALQVKAAFLELDRAQRQYRALLSATKHAAENAKLNIRAYREDMVETKDVLEAQLMEAFTKTAFFKSQADYETNRALIDFIVTRSVEEKSD